MSNLLLHGNGIKASFMLDASCDSGLKKVALKVINDYNLITNEKIGLTEIAEIPNGNQANVFAGIAGESAVLSKLESDGKIDLSDVTGKWEVYKYTMVENTLVIAGSDKLGAIYGLFNLSELMGVSPLLWIADSVIPKKNELSAEITEEVSKEPSVKFRGFFINDEWPCFGNWTVEHFGGFTAEMYDHVFELLLRLKGNYLWPAMWSSSFALDGPGLASFELASEYGIYMGNSHHEPCLRAGEEYSKVRGKGSIYGDAWNYHANTEGITRFWRDSMMERGGLTSMVTVGMRGEADSKILGENATLKDNIDLLKDVIVCQNKLIKEAEEKFNKKFPKVLALYKEVEPFYYGDENTEGLCEWSELDDVILMLCEDNYGYLRTIPDDKMRKHPAGFGMYYHVDYHGSPISFEWINSSPITTMWEQMSQAYDYGVRSVWILNVGDLKHNEFPLSYFMNLAYDFDKWGTNAPNKTFEYTKEAVAKHFGHTLSDEDVLEASEILTETVRVNGFRRPEALNPSIYHPCHFDEADKLLERISVLEKRLLSFEEKLDESQKKAWYSLTGFQTRAMIALIRMHIFGGKNELSAKQGTKSANGYAALVGKQIEIDKALKEEFANFNDHKWRGHELASHVGFTKWNEDGSRYPLRMTVEPIEKPRMYVMRRDMEPVFDKVYGPCMRMKINDFCFEGNEKVEIRVANAGIGRLDVKVTVPENDWLSVNTTELGIENEMGFIFTCDRSKLTEETKEVLVTITDGDTKVEALFTGKSIKAQIPSGVYAPTPYGYSIPATKCELHAEGEFKWQHIEDYGVYEDAVKVYPVLGTYEQGKEPYISTKIFVEDEGSYTLQCDFAPTNPLSRKNELCYAVEANGKACGAYNTVPAGYKAGESVDAVWSAGALDHRRHCLSEIELVKGVNEVKIKMLNPGLVPLKLFMYKENPPASYFGMPDAVKIEK